MKGSSPSPQQYTLVYKIGIFFTAAFGLYLGIHGLYLIIVDRNFVAGIPLFIAALLIAPPPIGIYGMVKDKFNVELSMALRMIIATLMLFIAWLNLP
ncbi:hypothetical protein [Methanolobus sp. ZRKC5]|uniref:hypothetical protein n=1 Tax=Methanolobus sp. ZRKC5 TaxID=3136295 RepID=UPI00313F2B67